MTKKASSKKKATKNVIPKKTNPKKKIKKEKIRLEKQVKEWAKTSGHDPDEVIKMWIDIRNDHKDVDESKEKDMKCYQELVLKLQQKSSKIYTTRPPIACEGWIIGTSQAWLKNEKNIKRIIEQWTKDNEVPTDKFDRPLLRFGDNDEPIPVAYNRSGNSYDLRTNKEKTIIVFVRPESGKDSDYMLQQVRIGGEISVDGKKEWFCDYIGEIPLNRRLRLNLDFPENNASNYLHKTPIGSSYFYFIDEDENFTITDVFDSLIDSDEDYVEFSQIPNFADYSPYVPFVSEGSIINVGGMTTTSSRSIVIGESVKILFGKSISTPIMGWVTSDVNYMFQKGDNIRFVASAYRKQNTSELKITLYNVVPENFEMDLSDEFEEDEVTDGFIDEIKDDEKEGEIDDNDEDDEEDGDVDLDLFDD